MPVNPITASGASFSAGTAAGPALLTPGALSAFGGAQSAGAARIALALPVGALSDFAIFDPTGVDGAVSCLLAVSAGATNARAFAAATAPMTYTTALGTLWNGAVNGAVRAVWSGLNVAPITDVQFEAVGNDNLLPPDAADYRSKLVYTGVLHDAVVTRSQDRALTGTWAGKLVNASTDPVTVTTYTSWPTTAAMCPVTVGDLVRGSVFVALPRNGAQWTAGILFFDATYTQIGTFASTAYSTHPGGYAWQQSTASATAPAGAVYAAVTPQIVAAAVNDGEIAYADCHRISTGLPAIGIKPTAFTPARQQNITVKANRVNYVSNPSFATGITGWYATGGASPTFVQDPSVGRALPGAAKLTATWSGGSIWPQIGTQGNLYGSGRGAALLKPGHTYTCSGWVLLGALCPPVTITAQIDTNLYISGNTTTQALADPANLDDGWVRVSVVVTIPPEHSGNLSVIFAVPQSEWVSGVGTISYWVDDVLVEEGALLQPYFDASLPSPDYLWQGAPYASPSHYYRDYRALQYRLSSLLAQSVPMGVPYQLLYAQPDT